MGLDSGVRGHFHHLLTSKGIEGKTHLTEMMQPVQAQRLHLSCMLYFKAVKGIYLDSSVCGGT